MNLTTEGTTKGNELESLKARLKATWMTGDYDLFSRYMEKGSLLIFRRFGVKPGSLLLDVGCGAGQLALIAARAGARVTGCDIATNWLEKARLRAQTEGLQISFKEGDAEALPFTDGRFDTVTSLFGAMFAPRPQLVAAELTRVCRPEGSIIMANWTPGGFIGQMFKTISRYTSPAKMPSPVLWGDEGAVRERFREGIGDLRLSRQTFTFEYPFSPDLVVEYFRLTYGPMARAFASLDQKGQDHLRHDLVRLWSSHNDALGEGTRVDAEFLQVIATRGDATSALDRKNSIEQNNLKGSTDYAFHE